VRDAEVRWDKEQVILRLRDATQKGINAAAHQVEAHAKVNIQQNKQIDTGFMLNSGYTVTPTSSGFISAGARAFNARSEKYFGKRVSRRQRQRVNVAERLLGDEAQLPRGEVAAAVAFAASYAVWQEIRNSFLYRALTQVAAEAGGIIERVAKGEMHD